MRSETARRVKRRASSLTIALLLHLGLLVGLAGPSPAADASTGALQTAAEQHSARKVGKINLGYFAEWGAYDRDYHVKDIVTSGFAGKLTHINYAFGDVGGKCTIGDQFAATEKACTAEESVDGEADSWDQPLRGKATSTSSANSRSGSRT